MTRSSEFWDALAPHHSKLENSYLDLPSLRGIARDIQPPVLRHFTATNRNGI